MLETERAFSRRMRAALTPPGPIEMPEETGIRPAEMQVGTREAQQPAPDDVFPEAAPDPALADPTRAAAPPPVAPPRAESIAPPGQTRTPGAP